MPAPYGIKVTIEVTNAERVLTTNVLDYPGSISTKAALMASQHVLVSGLKNMMDGFLALGDAEVAGENAAPPVALSR